MEANSNLEEFREYTMANSTGLNETTGRKTKLSNYQAQYTRSINFSSYSTDGIYWIFRSFVCTV